MRIELVRNPDQLEPHLEVWRELANGIPFRQPEWLLSLWKYFQGCDDELNVLLAFDDESRLRGLAFFYRHQPTQELRFLGDGSVCTDHLSILVDSRFSDESVTKAMADFLIDQARSKDGWRQIRFEAVDPLDRNLQAFRQSMLCRGTLIHASRPTNTWQVDLSDGWGAFLAGVSKNARKALRRRIEELEKVEIRWVRTPQDFEAYLPVLIDLHQRRRQSLGDPGCFADQRFAPFLRDASLKLLERNQLQAFSLWIEGRPVAADIGFRSQERWMCYQAGIDPQAMEHQPGKLANVFILREAESFGIRTVDFLRGDEPYKQQLRANPTPVYDLQFAPPNWSGRMRHLVWRGRDEAKSWMKKLSFTLNGT